MQIKVLILHLFINLFLGSKQTNSVNKRLLSYLNFLWIEPTMSRDLHFDVLKRSFSA